MVRGESASHQVKRDFFASKARPFNGFFLSVGCDAPSNESQPISKSAGSICDIIAK
jgi:hypothetical protein